MSLPKYLKARDGENNTVIYHADDGAEYLHSGGTRAWRNNNPGNLIYSEKSGLMIGRGGNYAVFPDHDAGYKALTYSLVHYYANRKIDVVFKKYAPKKDNNDPEYYAKLVKKFTGIDSAKKISELNETELKKFMDAIQRVEGWKIGKVERIPHAQQFLVNGVDKKPLSGIEYIISFFTKDGDEKKLTGKTDSAGLTALVKTDTRSPVTLKLPRPEPGQALKNFEKKKTATPTKNVVAAKVKAEPWYAFAYQNSEPSIDHKDGTLQQVSQNNIVPAKTDPILSNPVSSSEKKQEKILAPLSTVNQSGAIKVSSTKSKSQNYVEPVIKEAGLHVTWKFDTTAGSNRPLRGLPYFVAEIIDGKGFPLFPGQQVKLVGSDNIREKVPFGKKVAIYIGNDAKEKYRTKPLYEVVSEQGFKEIVVKVLEVRGPAFDAAKEQPNSAVTTETTKTYTAALFGTTWMNFSHRFTAAEAIESTADTSKEIQAAVLKIYQGAAEIVGAKIVLSVQKPNQNMLKITWPASAFDNCRQNISAICDLTRAKEEIIPRVNPNTYQAFLEAAFEMDLEELEINSGWRPMLGSVLHRIGVGLDLGSIKQSGHTARFNRSKTNAEQIYQNGKNERKMLEKKTSLTMEQKTRLQELKATENDRLKLASDAITASEDHALSRFTNELRGNAEVRQTFDPWQIDYNTSDKIAPSQNKLMDGNEKLHSTHLHITVFDKELGHG